MSPANIAYFVEGGGRAIRYGVGVGKTEAFNLRGNAIKVQMARLDTDGRQELARA